MAQNVQLFVTCLVDTFYPNIAEAVVRVLNRAGVRVDVPDGQTCCGQPTFNAGMRDKARPAAEHTIRIFEQSSEPVVVPSGSCAAMLRHGYLELFRDDPEWLPRARALAERTYEFSEFLVDQLNITRLNSRFPGKLAYHSSCHLLRGLGVDHQPRQLLENVSDASLVELPEAETCCGFGGVFSAEHAEISTEMLHQKITNFNNSGAEFLVACDAGCLMHLNGGLQRMGQKPCALHLAQILEPDSNLR